MTSSPRHRARPAERLAVFLAALLVTTVALRGVAEEPPREISADKVVPFRASLESSSDWTELVPGRGVRIVARFGDELFGCVSETGGSQGDRFDLRLEKGDKGAVTATLRHADGTAVACARDEGKVAGNPRNPWPFELDLAPFRRAALPCGRVRRPNPASCALAFYYPWYGRPDGPTGRWLHWSAKDPRPAVRHPAIGDYDSLSPDVVATHMGLASEAGLKGFVVSWWGPRSQEDVAFPLLLDRATLDGIAIAPYVEQASDVKDLVQEVRYLLARYASAKATLRFGGRPAIFLYARIVPLVTDATLAELHALSPQPFLIADELSPGAVRRFDGVHTYIPLEIPPEAALALYRVAAERCEREGKLLFATAIPGYDDTAARAPGTRLDRRGTEVFRRSLDAALASGADGLLVTSWNEWHEGTEIEPSSELGGAAVECLRDALAARR